MEGVLIIFDSKTYSNRLQGLFHLRGLQLDYVRKMIRFFALCILILFLVFAIGCSNKSSNIASKYSFASEEAVSGNDPSQAEENVINQQKELEDKKAELEDAKVLLVEEAKKQQINVEDKNVEDAIQKSLEAMSIDRQQFESELQKTGLTYDKYKEEVKTQLMISELINRNVNLTEVKVSDDEVNNYIESNKEDFKDFFGEEEALALLRDKVKALLLEKKQKGVVMEYVDSLK